MVTNWAVSQTDQDLITAIAYRANDLAKRLGLRGREAYSVQDAMMDITATHNNGCKLDLPRLHAATDGEFAHDVFGIRRHLNRDTGQLECFTPTYHA